MKQVGRKAKYILILLIAVLSFFFQTGGGALYRTAVSARAATDSSSVIKDLTADKNFNFSDYPEELYNFSIEVIQIAESTDGKLFIYTYQPAQKAVALVCKEVNLAFSDKLGGEVELTSEADKPKLYALKQVSTWGVFSKYLVEGVAVGSEAIRYYNITSLYRDYDRLVDDVSLKDEHGIAVNVGQCWKAETVSGSVTYEVKKVDTITITDCLYGSLRIPEGFNFAYSSSCDMHIIAFDTDIKMDELLEADVSFKWCEVQDGLYDDDYSEFQPKTVTVNYKEKGSSEDRLFGKGVRTWDKIQKGTEFVDTITSFKLETPDGLKNDLWNKDWVLAFAATKYVDVTGGVFGWVNHISSVLGVKTKYYVKVTDATVIRLEFLKDGKVYNLGAVSDKSGDFEVIGGGDETFSDAVKDGFDKFWDLLKSKVKGLFDNLPWWAWLLIFLIPLLIVLVVLSIVFPPVWAGIKTVLKAVGTALKYIFKGLWYVISAPFRFIAWIVRKCRGEK